METVFHAGHYSCSTDLFYKFNIISSNAFRHNPGYFKLWLEVQQIPED